MKKFYYYARLNDSNVCIEIVSRVNKLKDVKGYVELPEYNETVRYKKWENNQWSQESYEPELDTVVQDKLIELEEGNKALGEENIKLTNEISTLNSNIKLLEGTIDELMVMLGGIE